MLCRRRGHLHHASSPSASVFSTRGQRQLRHRRTHADALKRNEAMRCWQEQHDGQAGPHASSARRRRGVWDAISSAREVFAPRGRARDLCLALDGTHRFTGAALYFGPLHAASRGPHVWGWVVWWTRLNLVLLAASPAQFCDHFCDQCGAQVTWRIIS